MGMTITEKILAAHAGRDVVRPDEFIYATVDMALGNDITAPLAIEALRDAGIGEVFDKDRIALVPDHSTPNKDIQAAELCKMMREFAREHELSHYWEVGRVGIEHALLPEQGVVVPGDVVIGADSHTCTYGALGAFSTGVGSTDLAAVMATGRVWLRVPGQLKFVFHGTPRPWVGGKDLILYTIGQIGVDGALYKTMEFAGDTIESLGMDDRLTMCNMAIEAGGKNGIIAPDDVTREYESGRAEREPVYLASDPDAEYERVFEWDASSIEPQVAAPDLPSNAHPVGEFRGTKLDQVVIGSCTNGRVTDLRIAARLLKGRRVAPGVRLIILPGTQAICKQAIDEGLVDVFLEADGVFSTPTCGPCLGGHMGVLAEGERALATTNRNFVGRMGHPKSEVYLSGPAVAAASAVAGEIVHPDDI
ncbi:MAG: 3-isopropylmalate dehydratase large subunit [Planctomycetota bacterium]